MTDGLLAAGFAERRRPVFARSLCFASPGLVSSWYFASDMTTKRRARDG
jgi:hypothetical protein